MLFLNFIIKWEKNGAKQFNCLPTKIQGFHLNLRPQFSHCVKWNLTIFLLYQLQLILSNLASTSYITHSHQTLASHFHITLISHSHITLFHYTITLHSHITLWHQTLTTHSHITVSHHTVTSHSQITLSQSQFHIILLHHISHHTLI